MRARGRMSTGGRSPAEVGYVLPRGVLEDERGSLGAPRVVAPRPTSQKQGMRAKVVAEHVALLEQIPTAYLSTAALRRLTLVAIEVSAADPLRGGRLQSLGSDHAPRPAVPSTR